MYTVEETRRILKYITDRYANIRGMYVVKFLNGTRGASASAADTQVALLVTRTKMLSTVAISKSGTESKLIKRALWDSAGDIIIEYSIYFDKMEASE